MSTRPTKAERQAVSDALIGARSALGVLWKDLARRLSISPRALVRVVNGEVFPSPMRALSMLSGVTDLPEAHYHALADALKVPRESRPVVKSVALAQARPPFDPELEQSFLTLSLYKVAESTGASPAAARAIAMATLDHVAARGLDLASAREVMAAAVKPGKRR
jgi:hypothetical protein